MGLFDKFFGNKKKNEQEENKNSFREMRKMIVKTKKDELEESENKNIGRVISINLTTNYEDGNITISSSPVGVSTEGTANDFYVYEWFIKKLAKFFTWAKNGEIVIKNITQELM